MKSENRLPPDKSLRRKLLINLKVQLLIIGHSALVGAAVAFLTNVARVHDSVNEFALPWGGAVSTKAIMYLAVVPIVLTVALGFYLSNRIAGPIYGLERQLRDHLEGRLKGPLRVRSKDYFQELVVLINQFIERGGSDDGKHKK